MEELQKLTAEELIKDRYDKFRKMGYFTEKKEIKAVKSKKLKPKKGGQHAASKQ